MAYSYVLYSGDGTTDLFVLPFDYLEEDDITITVDLANEPNFSFPTASTIQFVTPPPSGTLNIRITRTTDRNLRVVDFEDGATITEADLDKALKQVFFLAQEFLDGTQAPVMTVTDTEIQFGIFSTLPSAGTVNRLFFTTDTLRIYRDNGATWELLDGALTASASGGVTKPAGSSVTTLVMGTAQITAANIADEAIPLEKLEELTGNSLIGHLGPPGSPEELSPAQVTAVLELATTTDRGVVELATAAEVDTGTDTSKAVTPATQGSHRSACKAWVNFNGTGTVAIRESYNVASVTDNGVGDYTINFTPGFGQSGFAVVGMCTVDGVGQSNVQEYSDGSGRTNASVRILTVNSNNGAPFDATVVSVLIFGYF